MNISRYSKFIFAAIAAGVTAVTAALTDDKVTSTELVGISLAVLTALGVYVVPNQDKM